MRTLGILDRQRYWAYFKAYVICFTALVGLYIVIDAFSNLDEFTKRASGVELFKVMSRYYLVHMSEFYDRLCGVIGMMAAIFTVTWMQRNNELLAMLAAGVSTHRVIRPVIVSAVLVSAAAVANQELIIPEFADELQKRHDDDGNSAVVDLHGRYDANSIYLHGSMADRKSQTVMAFSATFPVEVFGAIRELSAMQARYIPDDHPTAPRRGGWLLRGARINPTVADEALKDGVLVKLASAEGFPPPLGEMPDLGRDTYFLSTDINFKALSRNRQWYQYAPTLELIRGLSDPANEPEKLDIAVYLHNRILRSLLGLALLLLCLPQVLGGYGGNMFINLGVSLGTSAVFYGLCFMSQYLGSHSVIPAELSAWCPLIGFGTVAAARWDAIRT
jgi:lipopolysaccharide export system permease protein